MTFTPPTTRRRDGTGGRHFSGSTLEEALGHALAELGPDAQVADAKRIRSGGVMGFFSRERFEVTATPVAESTDIATAEPTPDRATVDLTESADAAAAGGADTPTDEAATPVDTTAVDDVLRALVEQVEADGDTSPDDDFAAMLAEATARVDIESDDVDGLFEPLRSFLEAETETETETGPPALEAPTDGDIVDADVADTDALHSDDPRPPTGGAPRTAVSLGYGAPSWGREQLLELGVPASITSHLPPADPESDLAWLAALEAAIGTVVGSPAPLGEDGDLSVSGRGTHAAVKLLHAATEGFTPATLILDDGRPVAATAPELALAVRSLLPRRAG